MGQAPLVLENSHVPTPQTLPRDPREQHTSSPGDNPHLALASSPKGLGEQVGSRAGGQKWGNFKWLSPEGITPALGGDCSSPWWASRCQLPGSLTFRGPSTLCLLPTGSRPITGSGPTRSWLGNEGCGGERGTVATPPSLLTLQLEADAAGLGPGQPWGSWWGSPIPLCLAGAPGPQELALLA